MAVKHQVFVVMSWFMETVKQGEAGQGGKQDRREEKEKGGREAELTLQVSSPHPPKNPKAKWLVVL